MRSIGEKGALETKISYRMAVELARELRGRGWAVTVRLCRGKTPRQVARFLRGELPEGQLALEIAVICGFMPAGEGE